MSHKKNDAELMPVDPKERVCFVVGPIGEAGSATRRHADWVLNGIILPVFSLHFRDYKVVRSDKIETPGMIDAQMINHLLDADLVIADMSERNPNAFYEMGVRHTAGGAIIHMFSQGTVIPFDVAPHRAICFSIDRYDDIEIAKAELQKAVSEATKPGFQVDNPVTRARGWKKADELATPEFQLLRDEIDDLKRRLALVEPQQIVGTTNFASSPKVDIPSLVNAIRRRETAKVLRLTLDFGDLLSPEVIAKLEALTVRFGFGLTLNLADGRATIVLSPEVSVTKVSAFLEEANALGGKSSLYS